MPMPPKNHKQVKKAAALKYTMDTDPAPKVVAKGRGLIAQKIVDLARQHQVPIVADSNLVQMLDALDLDTQIPPEMYQAVAEVLVFVYRLNQQNKT
jgi:flagellar biosynthesis protein